MSTVLKMIYHPAMDKTTLVVATTFLQSFWDPELVTVDIHDILCQLCIYKQDMCVVEDGREYYKSWLIAGKNDKLISFVFCNSWFFFPLMPCISRTKVAWKHIVYFLFCKTKILLLILGLSKPCQYRLGLCLPSWRGTAVFLWLVTFL